MMLVVKKITYFININYIGGSQPEGNFRPRSNLDTARGKYSDDKKRKLKYNYLILQPVKSKTLYF